MLVERSKDFGRSWKVFRYFAEDCSLHYPSVSDQQAQSINDVICDSRYSGSEPSTDGEVRASTWFLVSSFKLFTISSKIKAHLTVVDKRGTFLDTQKAFDHFFNSANLFLTQINICFNH